MKNNKNSNRRARRSALRSATRSARRRGTLPKQETRLTNPTKVSCDAGKATGQNLLDVLDGIDLPPFTKDDCVAFLIESGHSREIAEVLADICWVEANSLAKLTIAGMGI